MFKVCSAVRYLKKFCSAVHLRAETLPCSAGTVQEKCARDNSSTTVVVESGKSLPIHAGAEVEQECNLFSFIRNHTQRRSQN